jgi:dynein heavy chain
MAGNLKRKYPHEEENTVLIKAMRDANLPKFLADDLPLFNALIQDLFPGIEIHESKDEELYIVMD